MYNPLKKRLPYTGKKQPPPKYELSLYLGGNVLANQPLYPYFPSEELIDAVNLSIFLERPLLLKGEPGCGKTCLARAVAYELNLPYIEWSIKSTSKAKEGLYTYDSIKRLRDAQLEALRSRVEQPYSEGNRTSENHQKYIKWGALGTAFTMPERTVLLIDEIDKADIDFPNDLLLELDSHRFEIEETREIIEANKMPITFITSNDEKELPDAFLRRCLFHYIEFPSKENLAKMIRERFGASNELSEKVVKRFASLRKKMKDDKGEIGKRVSTSELLDWFRVIETYPEDTIIGEIDKGLLHPSILLKSWEDHKRYLNQNTQQ
ncbi:MAG: MoxR family ATPase [Cyanobacteria bacterium]|nr:MoxR family ATPase [Cyanobacteriota bacterium]